MSIERRNKLIIFFASAALTAVIIVLYFLDTSEGWTAWKISSCVLVCAWGFCMPPSFRYIYLKYRNMDARQGLHIALHIALWGILFPILFAPFYGTVYYISKY